MRPLGRIPVAGARQHLLVPLLLLFRHDLLVAFALLLVVLVPAVRQRAQRVGRLFIREP